MNMKQKVLSISLNCMVLCAYMFYNFTETGIFV
uniref:Uncharacterized protein n=1 Tax=Anguilla anguilla TaxID=7936 RepID=A0A0E9PPE6_ANGAN